MTSPAFEFRDSAKADDIAKMFAGIAHGASRNETLYQLTRIGNQLGGDERRRLSERVWQEIYERG